MSAIDPSTLLGVGAAGVVVYIGYQVSKGPNKGGYRQRGNKNSQKLDESNRMPEYWRDRINLNITVQDEHRPRHDYDYDKRKPFVSNGRIVVPDSEHHTNLPTTHPRRNAHLPSSREFQDHKKK